MKSTFVAAALVAGITAQQLSELPACGQLCINNMVGLAPSLGCPDASAACLCDKANFLYGIRDCSSEACPAGTDLSPIIQYGVSYCGAATNNGATQFPDTTILAGAPTAAPGPGASNAPGSQTTTGSSGNSGAGNVVPILTTYEVNGATTVATVGSVIAPAAGATTEVPVVATLVSGDSTLTTSYTATVTGAAGSNGNGNGGNNGSGNVYPVVITTEENGSTITTTVGSVTVTGTAATAVPLVTTITTDGSTITSTYGTATVTPTATGTQGANTNTTGGQTNTTMNTETRTNTGTTSSSSSNGNANTSTTTGGNGNTNPTSTGAAPLITAAAQGMAGVAGLAALLLL